MCPKCLQATVAVLSSIVHTGVHQLPLQYSNLPSVVDGLPLFISLNAPRLPQASLGSISGFSMHGGSVGGSYIQSTPATSVSFNISLPTLMDN